MFTKPRRRGESIHCYSPILRWIIFISIYTKPVNSVFHTLWLATQAQDILRYPLVCKTQWRRTRVITFPAEFWPDENSFFSAGYSLVWYILTQLFTSVSVNNCWISRAWVTNQNARKTLFTGLVLKWYTNCKTMSFHDGERNVSSSSSPFIRIVFCLSGSEKKKKMKWKLWKRSVTGLLWLRGQHFLTIVILEL